jgi:uncharacterized protein
MLQQLMPGKPIRVLLLPLFGLAAALIATYVSLGWVERRPWSYVWLGRDAFRANPILRGILYGALPITVASGLLLATHQLRWITTPDGSWWGAALYAAATLAPYAFFEELLVRGYPFAVLREAWGWKWALIVTSIVFGLLHLGNPGADSLSVVIVILAGFFLGAILLVTGSLYAAGAAHLVWNWVMAGGLHTPVSGIGVPAPDYRVIDNGPDWLTGGRWGPEGGAAAAACMFILIFYIYVRHLRRKGT